MVTTLFSTFLWVSGVYTQNHWVDLNFDELARLKKETQKSDIELQ